MTRELRRLEGGSLAIGDLPEGCIRCARGSKMVLFVTGLCKSTCYYCPLSTTKKDHDVTFADEMPVHEDADIFAEVDAIAGDGAGISGGDPLQVLDRTVRYITILKDRYGPDFHIHLYTSQSNADREVLEQLKTAGLDEIRFHPQNANWSGIETAVGLGLDVGIEVPVIPHQIDSLIATVKRSMDMGLSFMNINELEASETNFSQLLDRGMSLVSLEASAIAGSRETAEQFIQWAADNTDGITVHFCSASFKDSIQIRRRLERRITHTIRPFELRTDDEPILIVGVIRAKHGDELTHSQLFAIAEILENEFDVPQDLFNVDMRRMRIEIAPWILEEVSEEVVRELSFNTEIEMGIAYEYPSWDRLQVMFDPL